MAQSFEDLFKNTSKLKGLEKAIYLAIDFTLKAADAAKITFYGGYRQKRDGSIIYNPKNPLDRALAVGLIEITKKLSSVDFCNLLNYLANSAGGGFDPKKRPDGGVALQIWLIQNEAYQLQFIIDNSLAEIVDTATPDSTVRLTDLINATSNIIRNKISTTVSKFKEELKKGDLTSSEYEELNKTYQRLIVFDFALSTSADVLETIGSNVTVGSFQKALNTINKVKQTLVLIQGLNNPAALLSLGNQFTGGAVQNKIAEINNLIPIDKLQPFLRKLIKQCNNINTSSQKVLGQVRTAQFYLKIALTVIKVLIAIKRFFLSGFQLPNLYTTVASTSTASNVVEEKINQLGIKKLELRLEQINYLLGVMYNFAVGMIGAINEILPNLKAILLNIQSCNNIDDSLKEDLSNAIDNLQSTIDGLQVFVNTINNANDQISNTYGEYTIKIVTEEVVDEAINLKRRYGIAIGKNNQVVVQSTPTFASLDLIIINEVKSLLSSKGFVKPESVSIAADTLATINESLGFLGDESVGLGNLETGAVDTGDEEGLGITSFVDNLQGGRRLRKKVLTKLIKSNQNLVKDLKSADPSSGSNQKIIQQKESETVQLQIKKLENDKAILKQELALTVLNPALGAVILAKIKAIDDQIVKLKNGQK